MQLIVSKYSHIIFFDTTCSKYDFFKSKTVGKTCKDIGKHATKILNSEKLKM